MICRISDLTVDVPATGNMPRRCREYITTDKGNSADITIRADLYNFNKWPTLSENDAIYLESGSQFYFQLLFFNGMMLHSSAIEYNGKAYNSAVDSKGEAVWIDGKKVIPALTTVAVMF